MEVRNWGVEIEKEETVAVVIQEKLVCDDKRCDFLIKEVIYGGSIKNTLEKLFEIENCLLIHNGRAVRKFIMWKKSTRLKLASNIVLKRLRMHSKVNGR
jgi:hypothetical protein